MAAQPECTRNPMAARCKIVPFVEKSADLKIGHYTEEI